MAPSHPVERTGEQPGWFLIGIVVIAATLIGYVDTSVVETVSLRLLQLLLVAAAAWFIGLRTGLFLSLWVTTLWVISADMSLTGNTFLAITIWEGLTRFAVLVVASVLSSKLRSSRLREQKLAGSDSLTGLSNRNAFIERADSEMNRCRRTARPLTIVFIDCDHFKTINDTKGHLVGDEVLQSVAATLNMNIRSYDVVARMGGDEFALLLLEISAEFAQIVVGRIHQKLNEKMKSRDWPVTFSIGSMTYRNIPESTVEMINAADQLMYSVKKEGGNGVRCDVTGIEVSQA